ncbi:MAG: VOC family protein [Actinomycetota bacterium]|nr:VOC family protein [Actinomycetota bacterium]
MDPLAGLHHVALSVRDLDASLAWYREVLGFEETFRDESETRRMAVTRFPGQRHTFGLVEHGGGGAGFAPQNLGLDHVAFSVSSGEELAAWVLHFDGLGVLHSGVIDTPFGGMLHFKDLDGIALALFWERT